MSFNTLTRAVSVLWWRRKADWKLSRLPLSFRKSLSWLNTTFLNNLGYKREIIVLSSREPRGACPFVPVSQESLPLSVPFFEGAQVGSPLSVRASLHEGAQKGLPPSAPEVALKGTSPSVPVSVGAQEGLPQPVPTAEALWDEVVSFLWVIVPAFSGVMLHLTSGCRPERLQHLRRQALLGFVVRWVFLGFALFCFYSGILYVF